MNKQELEIKLETIANHAWDGEIKWPEIEAWVKNFTGDQYSLETEQLYALFMLSKFMYFSKRLLRQMLRSLYNDHFRAPIIQRIRRNFKNTTNEVFLNDMYQQELNATRFVGVGNPAESGAHLLYYFRQVNYLSKDLFVDITSAFIPKVGKNGSIEYEQKDPQVSRFVFFDDLVGSGQQAESYLTPVLSNIRQANPLLDLRFLSLFATAKGLLLLSSDKLFKEKASCLFELDSSYAAFDPGSRYFKDPPSWFSQAELEDVCSAYGRKLTPKHPLGYRNGQMLLGFSHNTPDNTMPIFWIEGYEAGINWAPVFPRYNKQ